MKSTEQEEIKQFVEKFGPGARTWQEQQICRMLQLGISPPHHLEMRVRVEKGDLFEMVQDAANLFLSTFYLYPTSIALHPTVASLMEVAEKTVTATLRNTASDFTEKLLGKGFTARSIHIEKDDSLQLYECAVRFSFDVDKNIDTICDVIMRSLENMQ